METDWNGRAAAALARIREDRWAFPAAKYLDMIDDIVDGGQDAATLAEQHGSADLVATALSHVTRAVHGAGPVPVLVAGGWYERRDGQYVVGPGFAAGWKSARSAEASS